MPWPSWPMILRTSTSHEEGCERRWSIMTKEFIGDANGRLKQLKTVEVRPVPNLGGPPRFEEIAGTEKLWPADLVLLAMGFVAPVTEGMIEKLATDLANLLLKQFNVSRVTVEVKKFIIPEARHVSVRVTRARSR